MHADDGYPIANLYERMGEVEKAEAAWKVLVAQRAAESARSASAGFRSAGPSPYSYGSQNELADFYARHGRAAEAEQLYKEALANASQSGSPFQWNAAAEGYIGFLAQQRRCDEAIELIRQSMARIEESSAAGAAQMLHYQRQRLAEVLAQAGRKGEALAVYKQAVEVTPAGSPEHAQTLGSLAQALISQNRLEEAEKAIAEMREAGTAGSGPARFHESMAVLLLARLRELQKRPEEARRLRESLGDFGAANRAPAVQDMVTPAQQAAFEGNLHLAVSLAHKALAVAAERFGANPREISGLMNLARLLRSRKMEAEAQRIAAEALRLFDSAPDHPRVADALGSVTYALAEMGMAAEAGRLIERQERILIAAKGADSPALNAVGNGRIALMQRDRNWTGVVEERKRMLARVEKASGPKSRESYGALRDLAFAYQPLEDWPEEERLLSAALERAVTLSARSSWDRAHLLQHMANRASQNREFDKAVNWMDQAIEVARTLPDDKVVLPSLMQNRERILRLKYGQPADGGRWFNSDRFERTGGMRLGSKPLK